MPLLPVVLLLAPLFQSVSPSPAQTQPAQPQATPSQPAQAPPVTANLQPLASRVVYTLQGKGDQIYICSQQKEGMQWVLKGPAAVLYDASNQPVAKHGDGPQWTWKDGSAVRGKIVGKQAAPDAANLPWLLLKTDPFTGANNGESDPAGALDHITYVKRTDTQGGLAPTSGCAAANIGASQSVPYSATYTFYTPQ